MAFAKSTRFPDAPNVRNLSLIAALLSEAGVSNVQVEQTGGGTATLYAGPTRIADGLERYALALGPGWFEPHWSVPGAQAFIVSDDAVYGMDDDGDAPTFMPMGDEMAIAAQCLAFLQSSPPRG